jgi:endonuclease-3 related protein
MAAHPAFLESAAGRELAQYFDHLLLRHGPQNWWPARTRLEVILGAILTQNTSWKNVTLALTELRRRRLIHVQRLRNLGACELESLIRSAGFYRQKTAAILGFLNWLHLRHRGSLRVMFQTPPQRLRHDLLRLRGVGPETADAILLYAGGHPYFVADAYTRRLLVRHGWVTSTATYEQVQDFLHRNLPLDPILFNEFHALIVAAGKLHCRRQQPICQGCVLQPFLHEESSAARPTAPAFEPAVEGKA